MVARRLFAAGLVALACAGVFVTTGAASASGGRHLPGFSALDRHVAISKLPFELRLLLGGLRGARGGGLSTRPLRGKVWFGEVERPNSTILLVGSRKTLCDFEQQKGEAAGGGGGCATAAAARELSDVNVSSCGKGPARHFRIQGLIPDGVTGLAIEKEDGTIGRTVPVLDNTVAFTIGRENFTMHGVGDAAAEGLEQSLPLADAGDLGGGGAGCSFYFFTEGRG